MIVETLFLSHRYFPSVFSFIFEKIQTSVNWLVKYAKILAITILEPALRTVSYAA